MTAAPASFDRRHIGLSQADIAPKRTLSRQGELQIAYARTWLPDRKMSIFQLKLF